MVDCRLADRRPPRDLAAFEATRRACALAGWEDRLVGALDPVATANLRWLAGYRHPRYGIPALAGALRAAFAAPAPLVDGAEAAGDPIAVLPVLYHLLWRQELMADLSVGSGVGPGRASIASAGKPPLAGARRGSRTALARTWYLGAVRRRYRSLVLCIRAVGLY